MRDLAALSALILLAFAASSTVGTPAAAQSIACGGVHKVKRSETLQSIAAKAYGPGASFAPIYQANRAVIGPDPSVVRVGTRLRIPCLDAALAAPPAAVSPAADAAEIEAVAPAPAPKPPPAGPMRIVVGADLPPFLDEDADRGGLLREIVEESLRRIVGEGAFTVDVVPDRNDHLKLLAEGAYDVSLAWHRPDCERPETLGSESAALCDGLYWSDALFDQVFAFYGRADAPAPVSHEDLLGGTLCRPAGADMSFMEAHGLIEPKISLFRPPEVDDCFVLLAAGVVDAAALSSISAEPVLPKGDDEGSIKEFSSLATVASLHAAAFADDPRRVEHISRINAGFRKLRREGEWFKIVARQLVAYSKRAR